jgi:large subunit ribosomal protein L9
MPKTDVILTHNVTGLGGESDQVKVAAGYARNYLYPQGLAIPVTSANKRQLESLKKRRIERESKELHSMTDLASTLSKLTLIITVKTGEDGKMFGSVTSASIADELKHQYDAHVDKRKIHLKEPIKTLGEHEVPLHLHQNVDCTLKVRVNSSTPLPPAPEAPAQPAAKDARAERGGAREGREGRGAKAAEAAPKAEARKGGGERKAKPAKAEKA